MTESAPSPPSPNQERFVIFLGTGAAWRTPELGCTCAVCSAMRAAGERRTRTALWVQGSAGILVDCGPDIADQLEAAGVGPPDIILITHEHGDHYLGLDELEGFRRTLPAGSFSPIPVYAHPEAWKTIEVRFGYLFGKLIDPRPAFPGQGFDGPNPGMRITPFKTNHGPMPRGAQGYVIEARDGGRTRKLVYTSDFFDVPQVADLLSEPDVLVAQAHWFNEPETNIPFHMSLQRLLHYVAQWRPKEHVYLVHISDSDLAPGETPEQFMKKRAPQDPLKDPASGRPFPVPMGQADWQARAHEVFRAFGLDVSVTVAFDGLKIGW